MVTTDQAISPATPEGSFIQHFESNIVCFDSGVLIGPAGGMTKKDLVGQPVKGSKDLGWTPILEAESAAGITGWICESGILTLGAGESTVKKYRILVRGPAAIVEETLPVNDPAGTPYTAANLIAAAEAVGIVVVNEPAKTSVGPESASQEAEAETKAEAKKPAVSTKPSK